LGTKETRVLFLTFAAIALAVQVPPFLELAKSLVDEALSPALVDKDFVNYWMAAQLTMSGQQSVLFQPDAYAEAITSTFGPQEQDRAWSYPPHYVLLMMPFGLLPYEAAAVTFICVTMALFIAGALTLRRFDAPRADMALLLAATAVFAFVNMNSVQNGFLTGALLLFGLAFRGRHPVLAGVAFGLLTVKPQLGILIPLLLLAERDWATIFWSAVVAAAAVAISALLVGATAWHAYLFGTTLDQQKVLTEWTGIFLYMMPTVFGAARSLGVDAGDAMWIQLPVSLAAFGMALWLFMRDPSRMGRAFALLCGTFLVSPYGFDYDMGALAVVGALMVGASRGWLADLTMIVVAVLPAFVLLTGLLGAPVAPVVLALALLARLLVVASDGRRVLV
jgi:hypothetical protein